jgi:hypothetical protein
MTFEVLGSWWGQRSSHTVVNVEETETSGVLSWIGLGGYCDATGSRELPASPAKLTILLRQVLICINFWCFGDFQVDGRPKAKSIFSVVNP